MKQDAIRRRFYISAFPSRLCRVELPNTLAGFDVESRDKSRPSEPPRDADDGAEWRARPAAIKMQTVADTIDSCDDEVTDDKRCGCSASERTENYQTI